MSEVQKKRGISDVLKPNTVSTSGCPSCKQMRGLGDAIARVTDAVGIPKCGACAKRQEILNKLVPFAKPEDAPKTE